MSFLKTSAGVYPCLELPDDTIVTVSSYNTTMKDGTNKIAGMGHIGLLDKHANLIKATKSIIDIDEFTLSNNKSIEIAIYGKNGSYDNLHGGVGYSKFQTPTQYPYFQFSSVACGYNGSRLIQDWAGGSPRYTTVGVAKVFAVHKSWNNGLNEIIGIGSAVVYKNAQGQELVSDGGFIGFYKNNGSWVGFEGDLLEPEDNATDNVDEDPNTQGGITNSGARDGAIMSLPTLPEIDLSSVGYNLYKLTGEQLNDFMEYLWTDDFITNIKKLYNDPMESIIGLYLSDFTPVTSGTDTIQVGNCDTGVSAEVCTQFSILHCGSVNIQEYYGAYTDYAPFVRLKLYLPKVGIIPLNTDDVMNNTLKVDYYIENSSGQGLCMLSLTNNRSGDTVIYATYPCQCTCRLPLSAKDSSERYSAFMNIACNVAIGGAMGGIGGGMTGALSQAGSSGISGLGGIATTKNHIVNTGSLGDIGNIMSFKKPYVIIEYNETFKPSNYNKYVGYKNPVCATLSSKSGYTVVEDAFINFEVPNKIKERIKNKLKGGVIL